MTREEALLKVRGYLIDALPADDFNEIEDIMEVLENDDVWTPTSEDSPDTTGWYIVTIRTCDGVATTELCYRKPENYWTGHDISKPAVDNDDVIAWMPKPKPYTVEATMRDFVPSCGVDNERSKMTREQIERIAANCDVEVSYTEPGKGGFIVGSDMLRTEEELNNPNPYVRTKINVPLTARDIKLISEFIHLAGAAIELDEEETTALYNIADKFNEIYRHSQYAEERRIRLESRKALRKQREGDQR